MKKLVSLVLALCMALSLCSFASAEAAYNMPAMNTTDPITLSVMTWDDFEMAEALAASFTELYPNITVEIVRTTTANVTADLTNYAAAGTLPDIFFFLDIDPLLASPYLADITEYIENDEEAQTKLYPTLRKIGYIDGKRCYFMAGEFLPATVYLDANVFETLNIEMPGQDWTWEQFVELTQTMTDPSQNIWAYTNGMYAPVTFGPISLTENAIGEFGWNGESYNFESGWAEALELQQENVRLGNTAVAASEEYMALHADQEWPGQTGHVAVLTDAFWTLNNIYTKPLALDRGIKMVPYNPPVGAESGGQLAFLDNVAISSACEYPREAYELMKYLTWGKDGWMKRCELFPTLVWEDTENKAYDVPNCLPMIQDEELNAAFADLMPDLGYWNDWASFMENIKNPVTWGARTIPGFNAFLANYYLGNDFNGVIGIEAAVDQGVADPYDYVEELAEQGKYYYEQAMAAFFEIYGQPDAE
ncbi:MAG: extracellular solute-binding protein [Clostridia bacterium]|nr:extracellular solute-binding protein [Clostridia bacterium]